MIADFGRLQQKSKKNKGFHHESRRILTSTGFENNIFSIDFRKIKNLRVTIVGRIETLSGPHLDIPDLEYVPKV